MEAQILQGGELCISVNLKRNLDGVLLNVKATHMVEKFMESLGDGTRQDVGVLGRNWAPVKDTDPALFVYQAATAQLNTLCEGSRFRLDTVGRGIELPADFGVDVVNLAWLRLVGISSPDGVTFRLRNVAYSLDGLRSMKNKIGTAARNLYADFIRPVDMSVCITQFPTKYTD